MSAHARPGSDSGVGFCETRYGGGLPYDEIFDGDGELVEHAGKSVDGILDELKTSAAVANAGTVRIWAHDEAEAWAELEARGLVAIGEAEVDEVPSVDGRLPVRFELP